MLRTSLRLALLAAAALIAPLHVNAQSLAQLADSVQSGPTEEQWIVSDVVSAIAGIARPAAGEQRVAVTVRRLPATGESVAFLLRLDAGTPSFEIPVVEHVWSPAMYRPLAERLLSARTAAPSNGTSDIGARTTLATPTVETLLDENERISRLLTTDPSAAGAHEAAALLVGTLALRESAGWFDDVRPLLSRITAHLAVASALRRGGQGSLDGAFAQVTLAHLSGRQRDAMALLDGLTPRIASEWDRAWVAALRLRITGDWRAASNATDVKLLERLERARALHERLGPDAFLTYVDTLPEDDLTNWHRLALTMAFNVEIGNRFAMSAIRKESAELAHVWSALRTDDLTPDAIAAALNERPWPSPARLIEQRPVMQVLDWGLWAGHLQRHLLSAKVASSSHYGNLGMGEPSEFAQLFDDVFGTLTLYPILLRWEEDSRGQYEDALVRARRLIEHTPELVTQRAWTLLLAKPDFIRVAAPFPSDVFWFTPAVPTGTAFDLAARSLRPGCPRPPTVAQAAVWAKERPYDPWAVWGHLWLAAVKEPAVDAVRAGFSSLFAYDSDPLIKMIDWGAVSSDERIAHARTLCGLRPGECDRLAELELLVNQDVRAVAAYERWVAESRDQVRVSQGVMWLMRYHEGHGNRERAEALARHAAETGSAAGRQVLGEWLDRVGRVDEAEQVYRELVERYPRRTDTLGTFLLRRGLRAGNRTPDAVVLELLRPVFPDGVQPLQRHALAPQPGDGVAFATWGPRATDTGIRPTDIIVGMDGWRVRNTDQYIVLSRLQFDDVMVLTVWRDGRYQDVRVRVPERWFGTRFMNHYATGR